MAADSGQSEAWCTLGLILQTRGELAGAEEALKDLDAALQRNPGFAPALQLKADLSAGPGR